MKITFNIKEQKKWLLVYSLLTMFGFVVGIIKSDISLIVAGGILVSFLLWQRIRINGRKTYPMCFDKLDRKRRLKPLER